MKAIKKIKKTIRHKREITLYRRLFHGEKRLSNFRLARHALTCSREMAKAMRNAGFSCIEAAEALREAGNIMRKTNKVVDFSVN